MENKNLAEADLLILIQEMRKLTAAHTRICQVVENNYGEPASEKLQECYKELYEEFEKKIAAVVLDCVM